MAPISDPRGLQIGAELIGGDRRQQGRAVEDVDVQPVRGIQPIPGPTRNRVAVSRLMFPSYWVALTVIVTVAVAVSPAGVVRSDTVYVN